MTQIVTMASVCAMFSFITLHVHKNVLGYSEIEAVAARVNTSIGLGGAPRLTNTRGEPVEGTA